MAQHVINHRSSLHGFIFLAHIVKYLKIIPFVATWESLFSIRREYCENEDIPMGCNRHECVRCKLLTSGPQKVKTSTLLPNMVQASKNGNRFIQLICVSLHLVEKAAQELVSIISKKRTSIKNIMKGILRLYILSAVFILIFLVRFTNLFWSKALRNSTWTIMSCLVFWQVLSFSLDSE